MIKRYLCSDQHCALEREKRLEEVGMKQGERGRKFVSKLFLLEPSYAGQNAQQTFDGRPPPEPACIE